RVRAVCPFGLSFLAAEWAHFAHRIGRDRRLPEIACDAKQIGPRPVLVQPRTRPEGRGISERDLARCAHARERDTSIAPSSQMLCLRVSGTTKMAMRNMTAGTTIGQIRAYPTLPVERNIEVVTIGTRPSPQPLPMW